MIKSKLTSLFVLFLTLGSVSAVTIDFDSLEDDAVTVRERDSMEQDRIPVDGLVNYLEERLAL